MSAAVDRKAAPAGGATTRRCIATRELRPKDELIRFVVGPDGVIVADPAENLPGRGLWLTADGAIVRAACARNLFAKAARRAVSVPDDLPERLEAQLARRCGNLLGLARRAGLVAVGRTKAAEALARGRCTLLLVAADSDGRDAAELMRKAAGSAIDRTLAGAEIGQATGRDMLVFAALDEGGLTRRLEMELKRLAGIRSQVTV